MRTKSWLLRRLDSHFHRRIVEIMVFIAIFLAGTACMAAADKQSPTPDGHPPALPAQFTAVAGTAAAPYNVYGDETNKLIAKYSHGTFGTTFTILDCKQRLKYTNAGALPIPGLPPGACTTTLLTAYSTDCPSVYVPTWPPTAEDFYAGFRLRLNYKGKKRCPVGNSSHCDHYVYNMYNDTYEIFDFYVNSDTQVASSGTIKVGAALYTHTLTEGVDQSFLQRPASCPNPTGQCAICFTGPCGPCQQCLKVKTGACAKCWAADPASGFRCLQDDGKSLCQTCYKPPAPPSPPTPTPPAPTPTPPSPTPPSPTPPSPAPPAPAGCPGGSYPSCTSLCPSDPEDFKECMAECHKRCDEPPSPGPTPPSPGPTPSPAPSPPAPDRCDICDTGACAACKPCASIKGGPCAPCWEKQANGSACLPDCQDAGCWNTTVPGNEGSAPPLASYPLLTADKCDICNNG